jgi:hypothetical protein
MQVLHCYDFVVGLYQYHTAHSLTCRMFRAQWRANHKVKPIILTGRV